MTACATEAMMHAPDKVIENLKNNAEMCNFPRVGCSENYYYQSVQYNVAHAERFHSGKWYVNDFYLYMHTILHRCKSKERHGVFRIKASGHP